VQRRVGLHHLCLRMYDRQGIDDLHEVVKKLIAAHGGEVIRAPTESEFAPGYYSILFEDPDGIRIEANHVPGKGLLDPHSTGIRLDTQTTPPSRSKL